MFISEKQRKEHFHRQALNFRHKFAAAIAFSTTLFFLCIENVKSFTSPLSTKVLFNENTMLFVASGTHSLVKKWTTVNNSISKNQDQPDINKRSFATTATTPANKRQKLTSTSLKMAWTMPQSQSSPPMLDMKTSLSAFGGWYNKMDPVARPPVYDE